jgi:ADP-ribose pyrophosphatase
MANILDPDGSQNWEILDREVVYSGPPWLEVSVEKVRTTEGRVVDRYFQVAASEYSVVFAETAAGKVLTIEQYKHGARRVSITLPGGVLEPGEDPLDAARREVLEETGYSLGAIRHLGSYHLHGNFGCGRGHFYAATGAEKIQEADSGDLETMKIVEMDKDDLLRAVTDGRVAFTGVVTGILLATNT